MGDLQRQAVLRYQGHQAGHRPDGGHGLFHDDRGDALGGQGLREGGRDCLKDGGLVGGNLRRVAGPMLGLVEAAILDGHCRPFGHQLEELDVLFGELVFPEGPGMDHSDERHAHQGMQLPAKELAVRLGFAKVRHDPRGPLGGDPSCHALADRHPDLADDTLFLSHGGANRQVLSVGRRQEQCCGVASHGLPDRFEEGREQLVQFHMLEKDVGDGLELAETNRCGLGLPLDPTAVGEVAGRGDDPLRPGVPALHGAPRRLQVQPAPVLVANPSLGHEAPARLQGLSERRHQTGQVFGVHHVESDPSGQLVGVVAEDSLP